MIEIHKTYKQDKRYDFKTRLRYIVNLTNESIEKYYLRSYYST